MTLPTTPHHRPTRQRLTLAVAAAIITAIAVVVHPAPAAAGDPALCYVVADTGGANGGDDLVFSINKITGARVTIGTGTGTDNIEAAEYDPYTDRILAADANRLGTINRTTGVWTALGAAFGTGTGSVGALAFTDVDSLAMDPFTGWLYGVHRRGGAGELDALFRINPATGVFVPGGFTGGADYVLIQAQAGLNDIDDLSLSALDGQMLAVANNSTGDHIVRIDRFTGATVDIGRIRVGGVDLDDVEGFGSDSQGTIWATHGRTAYDLYRIDPATAAATVVHAIPTGGDHESIACLTGAPNRLDGTVYNDTNGNGLRGAEPGTPNITVTLYRDTNGNGLVDAGDVAVTTTTTDASGNYSFSVSSTGQFVAAIATAGLPGGHLMTTDNVETADFGTSFGLLDAGNDFGWAMPVTIGDLVWEDLNGNAVRDGGEPGLSGVGVVATYYGPDGVFGNADDQTFSTTTIAAGAYSFTGLRPGTYSVAVTNPIGYLLSTANNPTVVSMVSGGSNLTVDYGLYRPATVGDRVWIDANGNGTQDPSEVGLAGVTVTLTGAGIDGVFGNGDDTTATTTTANGSGPLALGIYQFTGVRPGTYRVTFNLATAPGSYVLTQPNVGAAGTDSDATPQGATSGTTAAFAVVSGATNTTIDAGSYQPATIGDLIFQDLNNNGVADDGATGIGSVTVNLYQSNGTTLVASTVTASNGSYSFSVAPGSYVVDVDESTLPTPATLTTANEPLPVTVQSGQVFTTADFGYRLRTDLSITKTDSADPVVDTGSFTYTITVMNNGPITATGVRVVDTLPAGVTYNATGSTAGCTQAPVSTITCQIAPLASSATATVTIAVNVVPGTQGTITNTVTVSADQNETTPSNNTATEPTTIYRPAAVSDLVWHDLDGDGVQDAGEPGLDGVTVERRNSTGTVLLGTTVTDANGLYAFNNLAPGTYLVRVLATSLPAGMIPTFDAQGTTDGEALVTITSAETNTTTDFGYTGTGSIGDFVFEDDNGDGTLDPGESTGLAGAVIRLTWAGRDDSFGTADDVVYPTQTTGATGAYDFIRLPGGRYTVDVITHPAGATLTTGNDPSTITLSSGQDYNLADFGYSFPATLGDDVWFDLDGNGIRGGSEAGIDGVGLNLYRDDGDNVFEPGTDDTLAATTTTVGGGRYDFTGLAPGSYWVDVVETTLPAGAVLTTANEPELVVISSGEDHNSSDFGYEPRGGVAEVVFLDANANGSLDPGEALADIDVVFTINGTPTTIATNASGTATITGILAGTNITIDIDTTDTDFPTGATLTIGTDPTTVTVVAGTTTTDTTGYEPRGGVAEVVFLDANANGSLDPGEALADIDVVFTINGTPTTIATNASGTATITGILAGTNITIDIDTTDTDFPTGATLTIGTDPTTVTVVAGTTTTDTTGYEPRGGVAEVVFLDANANGSLDPGEALADIDVVFTINGTPTTIATNASGTATITGILAGTNITIDIDTTDTDFPTGATLTIGTDPTTVTVVAGTTTTDTTGYEPRGGVAEVVFLDANANGSLDPGEALADIDVVFTINGTPTTIATNASGTATITGILAGTNITIDIDTTDTDFPTGATLTIGTDPTTVTVVAGTTTTDTTGYEPRGGVAEVVFLDANANGSLDPGEALADIDVVFTINGTPTTIATNASGTATITGILAGTNITIDIDTTDTDFPTGATLTIGTDPTTVTVVAGTTTTDTTGYEPRGGVAEVVFLDANANGSLDPGEALADIDVVFTINGTPTTIATNASGTATITGILAGTNITIDIDTTDTDFPTGATLTIGTDPTTVTVVAGTTTTDTTGYEPRGGVAEVVFLDANANGSLDPGEALADIDVVFTINGTPTTIATNASGTATITGILAGTNITIDIDTTDTDFPTGATLTIGTDPTTVTVVAGTTTTDTTGYEPRGGVAEVVFLDANANGSLDPGEALADIDVVFTINGTPTTIATNASGTATITGILAGTNITIDIDTTDTDFPTGATLTIGTDPTTVTVVAGTTTTDTTGYTTNTNGAVAEVVFLDANANGSLDPGEALADIDVVFTINGTPTTIATNASGTATITGILAGTNITIDIDTTDTDFPTGATLTIGTDPTTVTVVAGTTTTDTTGYEPRGGVAEVVFLDANANGSLDPGEALADIDVVFTINGTPTTIATNASGTATITGILAGTNITIDIDTTDTDFPTGATLTIGTDPTTVTVVAGTTTTDTTGYEPRGGVAEVVFLDANANGSLDPGEALADIDVVFTINGTPTTIATNASGTATITGILAGTNITIDIDTTDTDFPTGATLTIGTDPTTVTVVAGTTTTDTTGYTTNTNGAVAEVVFLDANANGSLDPGEALADIDVVFTINGTPTTIATNASGTATITGILAGTNITIDIDTTDTDFPTGATLTIGTDPTTVTVVAGTTTTDTTGYEPRGGVAEVVFLDANANGSLDPGEALADIDVVFTINGTPTTIATNASGTATITGILAGTNITIDIDTTDTDFPTGATLTIGTDPTTVTVVAGTTTTDTTGYEPRGGVAEVVFLDANANGSLDPGEALADIDVVFTINGTPTTIATNASGTATITGILAGTNITIDIDTTDTDFPTGATLTIGTDPTTVTVVAGTTTTDTTGYEPRGGVAEVVFLDANANGSLDPGEALADIDVVFTINGTPTTIATNASGTATITGILAGTNITIDIDTTDTDFPTGATLTIGTDPTTVTVVAGTTTTDTTGYTTNTNGAVAEVVFLDANANGSLDPGEALADIDVVFTINGTPTTIATNASGTATITGILAGTNITIDIDTTDTDFPTGATLTIGTDPTTVTVVAGTTTTDTTGYEPRGGVAEVVFLDANANGSLDPGEALADIDVVFTINGTPTTIATNASGTATITGILAGTNITIDIDTTDTDFPTGATLTIGTDPTTVTVVAGTTTTDTTGYEPRGGVAEVVFLDANANGSLDPGEALADIDVVFTINGTPTTIATNASGTATITGILAGTNITIDIDTTDTDFPTGATLTIGTDPTTVTVVAGTTTTDTTGYEPRGGVAEVVFLDANANGSLDPGEALADIDVVFTINGTPTTIATNASGTATITGILAGTNITIDIDTTDTDFPTGATLTIGTDPTTVTVVAGTTTTDTTGYTTNTNGAVAEVVFLDANANGSLDPGEALADIDVVFTINGTPTTIATNASGTATITGILAGTNITIDIDTTDTDFPTGATLTIGTDPTTVTVVAGTTTTDTTGYTIDSRIRISKSPSTQDVVSGGTATFTIQVRNIGTTALSAVTVSDPGFAQCDRTFATMAVGEIQSYSCDVTSVTANFTNVVNVSATDPANNVISHSASAGVVVLTPSFVVTKTPATQNVPIDGDANFTITVRNNGETPLTNVRIDDPRATCATTVIASLAVGATRTVSCTTRGVKVDFTNTVTVTAADPIGNTHSRQASADVVVLGAGTATGAVTGTVWHDVDADGVIDADEPLLSGTMVTATGAGPDGVFGTTDDITRTTTTTSGRFRFDDVQPGPYRIAVDPSTLPAGIDTPTFDLDGGLDGRALTTVRAGTTVGDVDFGYTGQTNDPPEVLTLTVTGTVGGELPPLSITDRQGDTYTVTLVGGSLPDGITLDRDGSFRGVANESGTFLIRVEACDARGACDVYDVVVTVTARTATSTSTTSTPLPRSGSESMQLAAWALASLLTGVALVLLGRRRNPEHVVRTPQTTRP